MRIALAVAPAASVAAVLLAASGVVVAQVVWAVHT